MASEDSNQLVPGLHSVHRLREFGDLDETRRRQVPTGVDEPNAGRELLEVSLFRRAHREIAEERDEHFDQIAPPVDDVLSQVLPMIVMPPIDEDAADPEEALQLLEAGDALHALRHDESV